MVFKYCVFVLDIGGAGDVLFGLMLKLEQLYLRNEKAKKWTFISFCLIGTQAS